jgi:TetR/AcrR family transcriptional regulator
MPSYDSLIRIYDYVNRIVEKKRGSGYHGAMAKAEAADDSPPPARARRAPGPSERRRDPERTRGRILDAATTEFSAKGFAGARVSEIAARAGVNPQLIAYYFGGKAGLYREITSRWARSEAETDYGALPLAELVRSYVPASERARSLTRLLAWDGLAGDPDEVGARVRSQRMQEAVADLRRRQDEGELARDLDPACVLLAFLAAASAPATLPHVARSIFGVDPDSAELAARYADQLAGIIGHLTER